MRDCFDCKVMLYSQTAPVVESCSNVQFYTMTYWYEDLLSQMQSALTSPWANKWTEVYDFTASTQIRADVPNWSVLSTLNWSLLPPLQEVNEKIQKVREFKGDKIKTTNDISDSDLQLIRLEFDEEASIMSGLFDVGSYFN